MVPVNKLDPFRHTLIFGIYVVEMAECLALGFNREPQTGPMRLPITLKGVNRDHNCWPKWWHPNIAMKQGLIGK